MINNTFLTIDFATIPNALIEKHTYKACSYNFKVLYILVKVDGFEHSLR